MGRRVDLHYLLVGILGTNRVYYQPPENVKLTYPCILYERSGLWSNHADDSVYGMQWQYSITVIDSNPDSALPERVAKLPMCKLDRCYQAENLNHYIFTIYY